MSTHDVSCGEWTELPVSQIVTWRIYPRERIYARDFLSGRSHSEAIEAAIDAAQRLSGPISVVLDGQDWWIDRAVLMPSNLELVIDGCRLKLVDGVCDNIIRAAGIRPDPKNLYDVCLGVDPIENFKITGCNGAILEGCDHPYVAANPKTGVVEPWLGDFFGWRTVGILLSHAQCYEISGFTMRKTHGWAISQDRCQYGYLHDIEFDTEVKNGDGINFRYGCSYCVVENIYGKTSDDTVACTALTRRVGGVVNPRYVYTMQPMGPAYEGDKNVDIHDIVIRNIRTGGRHHGVICLATTPSVYNIRIDHVHEDQESTREAVVKIYTGYGDGYRTGNLRNIHVSNVTSRGAKYAVMVKAGVRDVWISRAQQLKEGEEPFSFEGESENLIVLE
jgi:hypothetical protein